MKYLAFDIGAREVKSVLAETGSGNLYFNKVQSFKFSLEKRDGHLLWPIEAIISNIVETMRLSGGADCVSIDSFASDFVLLDEEDQMIGGAVSYMDERTKRITEMPDPLWIFRRTGFHSRSNSTLYQLVALKEEEGELLERASSLMFLPDYINFLLTGEKRTSLSMALTSSLINAATLDWDDEILERIGIERGLFLPVSRDGEIIPAVKEDISKRIGFSPRLIVSGHDTGLAYLASPISEKTVMLSIGGFARLGTLISSFNLSDEVMRENYTNSVIPSGKVSLTKYLMGTYLIQNLKERMKEGTSYDEIMRRARGIHYSECVDIGTIDFEEKDVFSALNRELEKRDLPPCRDEFEASSLVYSSISDYYCREIERLERILGRSFDRIALVGGAGKDQYLALLLAMKSRKEVISTAADAALIGNIVFQTIATEEIDEKDKDEILRRALGRTVYRIGQK